MSTIRTEEMTISMGPHPATHGVLRFIIRTDGEVIHGLKPDVGYLHRGMEKIAERTGYIGFQPYTDRLDYVCAMTCNHAYALAVEKLGKIAVREGGIPARHRGGAEPHLEPPHHGRLRGDGPWRVHAFHPIPCGSARR